MARDLTRRELEVLELFARGYRRNEAAALLFVSPYTVASHIGNAMRKLGARSVAQAAAMWAADEAERLTLQRADARRRLPGRFPRGTWDRIGELQIVVRDQAAHIANLEGQLLELQAPEPAGQEVLL